jgi:hypothetical protein
MWAACRNNRLSDEKRKRQTLPATPKGGMQSSLTFTRRSRHDVDGIIRPNNPSCVYFPDFKSGSWAPLMHSVYTSWQRAQRSSRVIQGVTKFIKDDKQPATTTA